MSSRSTRKKVIFVTGIRSEYDILASVIRAVAEHSELEPGIIVTGAHLSPTFGMTVREIEHDGFPIIARIPNLSSSDDPAARAKSAGIQLAGLADVLAQHRPDFVVAPMDREEAITTAVAGSYMRIPIVHIGGGHTASDGNVDNPIRDAVTKLAHLHMVDSEACRQRVMQLGEEPWRVHRVGAAGLDRFLSTPQLPEPELWRQIGFHPQGPFAVLIQHSIATEPELAGERMELTLEALRSLQLPTLIGYPNSDPGSSQIIATVERHLKNGSGFYAYKNLPRNLFVNLLRRASVLVGNSSCGLIEAPSLGLPVVNVGPRQRGREHGKNVQFVDHDGSQIIAAVKRAVFDAEYRSSLAHCENPYGDGHTGPRIADILARQIIDERLLSKLGTAKQGAHS